jgi:hypothetical protein
MEPLLLLKDPLFAASVALVLFAGVLTLSYKLLLRGDAHTDSWMYWQQETKTD